MANKKRPLTRAELIAENRRLLNQVGYLQHQSRQVDLIEVRDRALKHALSVQQELPDYPSLREVAKDFHDWLLHGFDQKPQQAKGGDQEE